jgi:hypothetical protein
LFELLSSNWVSLVDFTCYSCFLLVMLPRLCHSLTTQHRILAEFWSYPKGDFNRNAAGLKLLYLLIPVFAPRMKAPLLGAVVLWRGGAEVPVEHGPARVECKRLHVRQRTSDSGLTLSRSGP